MKKLALLFGVALLTACSNAKTETAQKPVETTEATTTAAEKYIISETKVESNGFSTYVTGILQNNTGNDINYAQISFTVKDKAGNKLGTAFANVNNLKAGENWKFKAMYLGSEKDIQIDLENPEITGF